MNKERLLTLAAIVFALAAARLLPHPANVTPLTAMALFAGATFEKKWLAFAVPLLALLASDALIGFYPGMWVVYIAFALVVCVGLLIQGKINLLPVAAATFSGSVVFFLVTNFALWPHYYLYPHTFEGMVQGYVMGLPFFGNSLMGDIFYSALLFGGFALAQKKFPRLAYA